MNAEQERLKDLTWKKWGPYVSNRQWGTVREDYSANGDAWNYCTHDMARSKAYRWGEEGIAGISDDQQLLCFSVAFWNKKDPILKEIFYGLSNSEGNHGEDIKELFYYLDNTPTHSYMKMLYKYPQLAFPYTQLLEENTRRSRSDPEFELIETGIFNNNQYFDIMVEYAKAAANDILIKITVFNQSDTDAAINLLPQVWFRNTWSHNAEHDEKPVMFAIDSNLLKIQHPELAIKWLSHESPNQMLFCENETNTKRFYDNEVHHRFYKDGINNYIVNGEGSVNPDHSGTKAAVNHDLVVMAHSSHTVRLRLSEAKHASFEDFDNIFTQREQEANDFYASLQTNLPTDDQKLVHRQALAGLLWNKQFYYYNMQQWLTGDRGLPPPPASRLLGRNHTWKHLNCEHIISMPDKWEYPWFAAWDLAFHCVSLALVDIEMAKQQLALMTMEWYMHPGGRLPAYEWEFNDVNPPVHAWATWEVYRMDKLANHGKGDVGFLKAVFHKLLINFTWWVNREDAEGNNIFEGGFLGLDNISLFDRNATLEDGSFIEQADGTSWMAMYALNMMHIALELANSDEVYTDMAIKFFEHFLYIAGAINNLDESGIGLWDEEDEFYYDQLHNEGKASQRLKVRSMVGLIPLFAVEVLDKELLERHPGFAERMRWFLNNRPDLANLVSHWFVEGKDDKHLLSLLRGHRMKRILSRMLDENEFLSPHGVRSMSKFYENNPYIFSNDTCTLSVCYLPGDSDSGMFGGNSNWRGPVWMPVNYLIILSLRRFHHYYSDDFKVEYPTRSGQYFTLKEIANKLGEKLTSIFTKDDNGHRLAFNGHGKMQSDPQFRDHLLFYEFFDGNTGKGLGASHQTGWTALVANLLAME
jgi:hypothetical protein